LVESIHIHSIFLFLGSHIPPSSSRFHFFLNISWFKLTGKEKEEGEGKANSWWIERGDNGSSLFQLDLETRQLAGRKNNEMGKREKGEKGERGGKENLHIGKVGSDLRGSKGREEIGGRSFPCLR